MNPRHLIPTLFCGWLLLFPGLAHSGDIYARVLSLAEAVRLADHGEITEHLYLRGEFRVTASGASRAVLRDARRPNEESPRVVVDYPPGTLPPKEKERFVRDATHAFLIIDVRRGKDGVVTVYVRHRLPVDEPQYL